MDKFILDTQLRQDCITLGRLNLCHLLLMNNSLAPWFILVPETDKVEIYELSKATQHQLLEEINLLSTFVKTQFNSEKLNIGAIGNIVKQLHIHIVGRNLSDYCWPKVVWGNPEKKPYIDSEIDEIRKMLSKEIKIFTLKNFSINKRNNDESRFNNALKRQ